MAAFSAFPYVVMVIKTRLAVQLCIVAITIPVDARKSIVHGTIHPSSDRSRNCIRRWIQLRCLSVPYCQVWQRRCESIENTFDIAVSGEFRSSLSSNLLCHYAAAVIAFFTVPTEFVRWLLNLIVQYEGMLLAEFLQLVWRDERVIRVDDLVIGFVPPGCGLSGGPGLDG